MIDCYQHIHLSSLFAKEVRNFYLNSEISHGDGLLTVLRRFTQRRTEPPEAFRWIFGQYISRSEYSYALLENP